MFSCAVEEGLSLGKLNDYISHLHTLEREKGDHSKIVDKYVSEVHSLTSVMALDCQKILSEVHPTLTKTTKSKSISDNTLESLKLTIESLNLEKRKRLRKVNSFILIEVWN